MKRSILIFLLVSLISAQYSPSLKNDIDLDKFMLRISNRYDIKLPRSFYSKPMHSAEVLLFLSQADSLCANNKLTKQEIYQLKNLREIISGKRNLFNLKKSKKTNTDNFFNLSFLGKIKPYYKDESHIHLKGVLNPKFTGIVSKISYFAEASIWTEYLSDTLYKASNYQPYNGNPYNLYGRTKTSSIRSSDIIRGGICYNGKKISLETAIDYLQQGPALFYPVTFSGKTSPVTYFRARMDLSRVEYIHTFGVLRSIKDKPKYFYTHRIDIQMIKNRVTFGINEVIINGNTIDSGDVGIIINDSLDQKYYNEERGWEWVYMIPLIPYTLAEHYVGDRDNAILSFDLNIALPKNFRWYGEFFIDDMSSPLTIFSDDFGNKWALTIGAQHFNILFDRDISITFEFSKVRPWTYGHFYGPSHRYTHFGKNMGSQMGPNSEALMLLVEYAVSTRNTIGLFFENTRKGHTRGSSENDVFQLGKSSNPDSKHIDFFSEDNYTRISTGGIKWQFAPFSRFHANTEFTVNSNKRISLDIYGGFSF